MGPTKGSTGKGSVTNARVGKTNTPAKSYGRGNGGPRADSSTNTSSYGKGGTKRYRSGDVTVTTGSNAKYK